LEPPRAGEVLSKFLFDTNYFCLFFCRRTCGWDSANPDRPRGRWGSSCTASTLHRHRRYKSPHLLIVVVDIVTQLGVSRPKEIRSLVCRSVHIYDHISFGLSTFLDSPWMRRWVSIHVQLPSESEFRQHLPVVLRIHTLPARTCIGRTAGRCCRNFVSDRSGAWKLTLSTHPRVGLGPILLLLDGRKSV